MSLAPLATCSFLVTGLNLERLLTLLRDQDIPLYRARRIGVKTMECRCQKKDMDRIRQLASERGWTISDVRQERLSLALTRLRRRPGLLIGACLTAILLAVGSLFIWRVDVRGAGAYLPEIRAYLAERGVCVGARAADLSLPALEGQLYFRYPAFSWFSLSRRGMTVTLECRAGVSGETDMAADTLVALCDGLITRVETHGGTALVRAGQLVRRGDPLIEGWERAMDGERRAVPARGVVTARCWVSCRVSLPATELFASETDRVSAALQLVTPLFRLPQTPETPEYLCYDTDIRVLPIGGAFFPVTLRAYTYREVALEERAREERALYAEAERAALRALRLNAPADEIVDKWVDYSMINDGELLAIATAELQRNIAVPAGLGD